MQTLQVTLLFFLKFYDLLLFYAMIHTVLPNRFTEESLQHSNLALKGEDRMAERNGDLAHSRRPVKGLQRALQ
jgi:hypothetical protein